MKNKFYILIFLVILLTFGCANRAKVEYFGWDPPGRGVAIITGSSYSWVLHSSEIIISSVDSISTGFQSTVAVSPGKHTVIVHNRGYIMMGRAFTFGQFKLVFDVEAGHKYKIKLKSRREKSSLLVVDTESGMVVGSSVRIY